jgi:hypothetical protein
VTTTDKKKQYIPPQPLGAESASYLFPETLPHGQKNETYLDRANQALPASEATGSLFGKIYNDPDLPLLHKYRSSIDAAFPPPTKKPAKSADYRGVSNLGRAGIEPATQGFSDYR